MAFPSPLNHAEPHCPALLSAVRVIAGSEPDSLRLRGTEIEFQIAVSGLAAEPMRRILAGRGSGAFWTAGERTLELAADCELADTLYADYQRDFGDGAVSLRSGRPGHLRVGRNHQAPEYLLPQSLNLALAQQWGRLGVLALHAAAFRFGTRTVLALGPKASGKSVLSLAALCCGGRILSDDWLLLGIDRQQRPVSERLRNFLMVRDSWASSQLRARQPELAFRRSGTRPKEVLPIPPDDPRFPDSLAIDEIWVMGRARTGRTSRSLKRPEPATAAFSELIKAAMPLLFTRRFPHEHAALMRTARHLLNACPTYQVQTGTDLIEQPEETLARLLDETG
jgi:hypothetical protein